MSFIYSRNLDIAAAFLGAWLFLFIAYGVSCDVRKVLRRRYLPQWPMSDPPSNCVKRLRLYDWHEDDAA